jgi:hypothetical protein
MVAGFIGERFSSKFLNGTKEKPFEQTFLINSSNISRQAMPSTSA